nr:hypothetical protein [Tanacetum cinerariifolium]
MYLGPMAYIPGASTFGLVGVVVPLFLLPTSLAFTLAILIFWVALVTLNPSFRILSAVM